MIHLHNTHELGFNRQRKNSLSNFSHIDQGHFLVELFVVGSVIQDCKFVLIFVGIAWRGLYGLGVLEDSDGLLISPATLTLFTVVAEEV